MPLYDLPSKTCLLRNEAPIFLSDYQGLFSFIRYASKNPTEALLPSHDYLSAGCPLAFVRKDGIESSWFLLYNGLTFHVKNYFQNSLDYR